MIIVRSKNDIPKTIQKVISSVTKDVEEQYSSLEEELLHVTRKILEYLEKSKKYKCVCKSNPFSGILHHIFIYLSEDDSTTDDYIGMIKVLDPSTKPNTENLIVMFSDPNVKSFEVNYDFFKYLQNLKNTFNSDLENIRVRNVHILEKTLNLRKFCKKMDLNFDQSFEYSWLRY